MLASFTDPFSNLVHPLFWAFAWLLAEFYSLIPNYAVAIALLTIAVMIVAFPITRRGTRSMTRACSSSRPSWRRCRAGTGRRRT